MIQSMHIETVRLFDVNDILGDWFDRLQYLDRFGSDWHVSRSISNPLVRKARFYMLKTGTVDNTFVALKCCIQSCLQYSCLLPHEVTAHLDRLRSQLISVRSICDGTAMALVHDYVPLHRWTSDSLSVGCSLRQVIRTLLAQIVCLSCKQPLRLSKQLLRLMSRNIGCTCVAKVLSVVTSLNSDDCDNLVLSAWITHCDEIYSSHDDRLTIDQVLGLRHLESSAELTRDCNIETFPCVQEGPNHCACDVLTYDRFFKGHSVNSIDQYWFVITD